MTCSQEGEEGEGEEGGEAEGGEEGQGGEEGGEEGAAGSCGQGEEPSGPAASLPLRPGQLEASVLEHTQRLLLGDGQVLAHVRQGRVVLLGVRLHVQRGEHQGLHDRQPGLRLHPAIGLDAQVRLRQHEHPEGPQRELLPHRGRMAHPWLRHQTHARREP